MKGYASSQNRTEAKSLFALLFVFALLACLVWMGVTGNRFCCDQSSLVMQLRKYLFEPPA
jgi:hypothetical protein